MLILTIRQRKGGNMADKDKEKIENEAAKAENIEGGDSREAADTDEKAVVEEAADEEALKEATEDNVSTEDEALSEEEGEKKPKKDKKDLMIEELTDKYKRTFAEFDNFRKRSEKEKAAMFEIGAKAIVEKMLPIVDSFERGLATVPEEEKGSPFAEGMDKVYKQLMTALEEAGVKPIEALNTEFNPDFHNAVMHVEDENAEENIIIEEFQKGYTYRDSVVRHSMVKVAN